MKASTVASTTVVATPQPKSVAKHFADCAAKKTVEGGVERQAVKR